MANPRVRFEVDDTKLQELRESARQLFDDIRRDTLSQAKDIQSVNTEIEKQIKLIEQRNRETYSNQMNVIRQRRESGEISTSEARQQRTTLRESSSVDKAQLALLREIADATKSQAEKSADEIVKKLNATRQNAGAHIASLESNLTGSTQDIISRRMAAQRLRQMYPGQVISGIESISQDQRGSGGGMAGSLMSLGAQRMAGSGGMGGIAQFAKAHPVALALTALIGGIIASFMRQDNLASTGRGYAAITGTDLRGIRRFAQDGVQDSAVKMGMTPQEVLPLYAPYSRSAGKALSAHEFTQLLGAKKALSLEDSDIAGILGISRFGGRSGGRTISTLQDYVQGRYGDTALLSEYMGTYSQAAQNMLGVRGRVDEGSLMGAMRWLGTGGMEGPQMQRTLSALQGVGKGGPMNQAIMYQAARRLDPNASTWEMGRSIESPLSNPALIKEMMSTTQQMTGGGDMQKYLLKQMLGLSYEDIDKLVAAKGDISKLSGMGKEKDFVSRAAELTTTSEEVSAAWTGLLNTVTDKVVEAITTTGKEIVDNLKQNMPEFNAAGGWMQGGRSIR